MPRDTTWRRAGATGGAVAETVSPPGVKGPSFFGMGREMYRRQGLKGLYAGCGITVARAIPSSAMIFVIYDGLSKRFG